MSFEDFKYLWETQILPHKDKYIRKGQSLMIYLHKVWQEEYKRISAIEYYGETNIDCFYNDDLIPNTLKHLETVWENI